MNDAASAPLDHRAFLSSLPAAERAALTLRRDGPGLLRLAAHLGLIALLAWPVAAQAPLWPLFVPPLGVAMAFLFTLQHECTHQTPFRTLRLNELAGRATGFLILQPFLWFRHFHLAHHRHTNDPARDPELQGGAKPETARALALHLLGAGYWAAKLRVLLANAFGRIEGGYVPARAEGAVRREARWMLAGYAAILLYAAFVDPWPLRVWLLPLAFGFPVLRLYLLAEHARCPAAADMFDNTRTTLTNRLVRLLAWNMPYHAEHHAMPAAPFHALPALHARARAHLKRVSPGYRAFAADYAAGLSRPCVPGPDKGTGAQGGGR
ncbi:MAG: fatty acid desaturase [Pikeienuella sp.]|uniref:fatty acid desaturase n=1 Tax=Pikeienuella sp. TaxID=2831957 RepID=UPI00391CFF58